MSSLACASRFSVLKLEDDEILDNINKKSGPSSQNNGLPGKNKGNQKNSSNDLKNKSKKKKKTNSEVAELQNLAFASHSSKSKQKASSHNSKVVNPSPKQWEEWKMKDSEFVSETYEQDLQEAILLSKIDYEEKKEIYDAFSKEAEQSKAVLNKKKKKNNQKKEKGTMSLDEFQNMDSAQIECGNFQKGSVDLDDFEIKKSPPPTDCSDFFEKIEADAEKMISQEQKQEQYKALERTLPAMESARLAQCQEESSKKDEQITLLKEKVLKLKEELKNVKSRNKKLYGILETGEMREKAEILVQVDQLTVVRDELTEQVNEYHAALEQERSKVHSLQMELKKYQGNRKQRTESK